MTQWNPDDTTPDYVAQEVLPHQTVNYVLEMLSMVSKATGATYNSDGTILTVVSGGRTYTITRDAATKEPSIITDGTRTWSITRNASGQLTSVSLT